MSRLWRAVSALGIAQIVSWGSLFYAIGVLGAPMRSALRIDDITLFGSFTAGLFVSGIAAPAIGRRIDARGGRGALAFGELLGRLARPAFIAKAVAPVALTFVFVVDPARRIAAATLAAGGVAALFAFARAVHRR